MSIYPSFFTVISSLKRCPSPVYTFNVIKVNTIYVIYKPFFLLHNM
nr:MAG TPA: hypothetical protein [Caudoviricetes sp.]